MIKSMSDNIAYLINKEGQLLEDDIDVCSFGLQIIIGTSINIIIALLIGIIYRNLLHGVIFLAIFAILRVYTGGFHAKTQTRCTIIFQLIYTFSLSIIKYFDVTRYMGIVIVLISIFDLVCIYILAPITHSNNEISKRTKVLNKKISRILSLILIIIIALSLKYEYYYLSTIMCMSFTWVNILLIVQKIINIGGGVK